MDTTKKDTVPQRRENDWEEVLLYEKLRRGPKAMDTWSKTLYHLHMYLKDEDNQRRLTRQLASGETDKDWTDERLELYLDDAVTVCREITAYKARASWDREQLEEQLNYIGKRVHEILAQQSRKERPTEELFKDFLNAGDVQPHPTAPNVACLVTDHHGNKTVLPKMFLPESFDWPVDKILADPDPSEGRPFKSDDCVRLMTDKYTALGLPKGIEGYVSGVVSNQFLGWEANRCHVMFILSCKDDSAGQDEITVWDDFLEVEEDQLQLCNREHPPSLWFPYEVAETGQVIRDQQSGCFECHKESKPYTHQGLLDSLAEQPSGTFQQGGKENPPQDKVKNFFKNVQQEIEQRFKSML